MQKARQRRHQAPRPREGEELVLLRGKGQWGRGTGQGECGVRRGRRVRGDPMP